MDERWRVVEFWIYRVSFLLVNFSPVTEPGGLRVIESGCLSFDWSSPCLDTAVGAHNSSGALERGAGVIITAQ